MFIHSPYPFRSAYSDVEMLFKALGSELLKGTMWILNWVISGTFADLHQDPDHQHHL